MKSSFLLIVLFALIFISSCKKESTNPDTIKELITGVDTLVGDITVNTVVIGTPYLKGTVFVKPGVTLTINPGVTIVGDPGEPNTPGSKGLLVIERGAKLIAQGTPSSPIIWTSANPPGQRNFDDWGGVMIEGKAPSYGEFYGSIAGYAGISGSDPRAEYGGTDEADNSGSITYNRFDFTSTGLSLLGIGSATDIHHIEVSNSSAGFSFFGGTANAHHLLSFGNAASDYFLTNSYAGKLQFIIAYRNDLASSYPSYLVRVAGPTKPFISNATLIGPSSLVVRSGLHENAKHRGGVFVAGNGRIWLANSLIIAKALTKVPAVTPSSYNSFIDQESSNPSYVRNNIWQYDNALYPVFRYSDDFGFGSGYTDTVISNSLANSINKNTSLPYFDSFKINAVLVPQTNSPVLKGGIDLSAFGFLGTTQRGAVLPSDPWTSAGNWIATYTH